MGFTAPFWALFCTTEISTETINRILRDCEESSRHIRIPVEHLNRWSLISSPDQKQFEKPTIPPFTGSPPRGFIDATIDEIGAFVANNFTPDPLKDLKTQVREIGIVHDAFAIIDARTLQDDTMVLVRWEVYDERIDPTSLDDRDHAWRCVRAWTDVRVPIIRATDMVDCLGEDYMIYDEKSNLKEEDDGVCRREEVEAAKKAMKLQ